MGKDEIKAVQEILANKKKYKRALIILGMLLFAIITIFAIGFYSGEISKIISVFAG